MIIDASLFAWETDLLELRLRELWDVVDRFVVLEARQTTRGTMRDLVYPMTQERYAPWRSKIDYHVVGMPRAADPTVHPHHRFGLFRDLLGYHLPDGRPEDVVILGDGDEIPRAAVVETLPGCDLSSPWALGMACYYYWLDLRFRSFGRDGPGGGHGMGADGWPVWRGPVVCTRETLDSVSPNQLREGPPMPLIPNGGWHFSFLLSAEGMAAKLRSQGHIEYDDERKWSLENLEAARREGRDWDYDRNLPLEWVPIDDSYPQEVREHPERWAQWLGPCGRYRPSEALK